MERIKASIFLEVVLKTDNVKAPIQFRRESQPQLLKDDFSSRTDPSIFTSIAPVFLDSSTKTI